MRIQHIPYVRPPKRVGTSPPKPSMMPEDDPSVFKFSKVAGVLQGPSMPLEFAKGRLAEGLPEKQNALAACKQCENCPNGQVLTCGGTSRKCVECEKGKAKDNGDENACTACTENSFTNTTGQTKCKKNIRK